MTKSPQRTRVLIAEDSDLFAQTLTDILEEDPRLEVIGVANNGESAVKMTEALRPDVIIMDVRMPVMDGLAAIEALMSRCPTAVLVMTADPAGKTGELGFEALRRGALDLLPKPDYWAGTAAEQEQLRDRVVEIARIPCVRRRAGKSAAKPAQKTRLKTRRRVASGSRTIVGLVASTGGPSTVMAVLKELPADYPFPIAVTVHLSNGFAPAFARWLGESCQLDVVVATAGMPLRAGMVAVAPDDAHMLIDRGHVKLSQRGKVNGHRPSATLMLESIAKYSGRRAIGAVLTGMGADGAGGLLEIKRRGGFTMAQDESSCVVYGMPRVAAELGAVSKVLTPLGIAQELIDLADPGPSAIRRYGK